MPGWGAIHHNTIYAMQRHLTALGDIQEQIGTGLRVVRGSDDPGDAYQILTLQTQQRNHESCMKNLETIGFQLSQVATNLQDISSALITAQTRLSQGGSATYSSENRISLGQEINSLLEQCLLSSNSRTMGRFLFGGSQMDSAPFEAARGTDGQVTSVRYVGGSDPQMVAVTDELQEPGTVVGSEIFASRRSGTPEIVGDTGAAVGTTPSSLRGVHFLQIAHLQSDYANNTPAPPADSGIRAGASSAAMDTIVGSHTLTIVAGATNTVRLDNGTAVSFTNESDLRLTNKAGQEAYVDLSGWDGASCTIDIDSRVYATLDGGATKQEVDFSANQAILHADKQQYLQLDTRNVKALGTDLVSVPDTYDMFETLIRARDALLNTQNLSDDDQAELISQILPAMEQVHQSVTTHLTVVGGRVQAMDMLSGTIDELNFQAKSQESGLRDADVAELASELTKAETFYQMSLAAAAKLMNMSLLDYIR